jgi:hypothetical protein
VKIRSDQVGLFRIESNQSESSGRDLTKTKEKVTRLRMSEVARTAHDCARFVYYVLGASESNSYFTPSLVPPMQYYCDCPSFCKERKLVSRSTYFSHAKHRSTRTYDGYLASNGSSSADHTGRIPGPSSSSPCASSSGIGGPLEGDLRKRRRVDQQPDDDTEALGEGSSGGASVEQQDASGDGDRAGQEQEGENEHRPGVVSPLQLLSE